jgi:TetR/AcrR family transcriptional repressor of nem operon
LVYNVWVNVKHDRKKVLTKGYDLFWSRGYNSLGVAEICKTTGMTKGAFYNAYKSKENFLLEGMKEYGNVASSINKELLKPSGKKDSLKRLRSFYDQMFDTQAKMNNRGCLIVNMMSEMGAQNSLVRKVAAIEFNNFIETIEPTVRGAQEEGDLRKDIDSKNLTELIHTTFLGSLTRAKGMKSEAEGKKTIKLLISSLSP